MWRRARPAASDVPHRASVDLPASDDASFVVIPEMSPPKLLRASSAGLSLSSSSGVKKGVDLPRTHLSIGDDDGSATGSVNVNNRNFAQEECSATVSMSANANESANESVSASASDAVVDSSGTKDAEGSGLDTADASQAIVERDLSSNLLFDELSSSIYNDSSSRRSSGSNEAIDARLSDPYLATTTAQDPPNPTPSPTSTSSSALVSSVPIEPVADAAPETSAVARNWSCSVDEPLSLQNDFDPKRASVLVLRNKAIVKTVVNSGVFNNGAETNADSSLPGFFTRRQQQHQQRVSSLGASQSARNAVAIVTPSEEGTVASLHAHDGDIMDKPSESNIMTQSYSADVSTSSSEEIQAHMIGEECNEHHTCSNADPCSGDGFSGSSISSSDTESDESSSVEESYLASFQWIDAVVSKPSSERTLVDAGIKMTMRQRVRSRARSLVRSGSHSRLARSGSNVKNVDLPGRRDVLELRGHRLKAGVFMHPRSCMVCSENVLYGDAGDVHFAADSAVTGGTQVPGSLDTFFDSDSRILLIGAPLPDSSSATTREDCLRHSGLECETCKLAVHRKCIPHVVCCTGEELGGGDTDGGGQARIPATATSRVDVDDTEIQAAAGTVVAQLAAETAAVRSLRAGTHVAPALQRVQEDRALEQRVREDALEAVLQRPAAVGWMSKTGAKNKAWKKRWFTLTKGCRLFYFTTSGASTSTAKLGLNAAGFIDVSTSCVISVDTPSDVVRAAKRPYIFCFTLFTQQRAFHLASDSAENRAVWIAELSRCALLRTSLLPVSSPANNRLSRLYESSTDMRSLLLLQQKTSDHSNNNVNCVSWDEAKLRAEFRAMPFPTGRARTPTLPAATYAELQRGLVSMSAADTFASPLSIADVFANLNTSDVGTEEQLFRWYTNDLVTRSRLMWSDRADKQRICLPARRVQKHKPMHASSAVVSTPDNFFEFCNVVLFVRMHYGTSIEITKSMQLRADITVREVIVALWKKLKATHMLKNSNGRIFNQNVPAGVTDECSQFIAEHVFKFVGLDEYFHGGDESLRLIDLVEVRKLVERNQRVELILVPSDQLTEKSAFGIDCILPQPVSLDPARFIPPKWFTNQICDVKWRQEAADTSSDGIVLRQVEVCSIEDVDTLFSVRILSLEGFDPAVLTKQRQRVKKVNTEVRRSAIAAATALALEGRGESAADSIPRRRELHPEVTAAPFSLRDITDGKVVLFVEVGLYYGLELLCPFVYTMPWRIPKGTRKPGFEHSSVPFWCQWLRPEGVFWKSFPPETRITFSVFAADDSVSETVDIGTLVANDVLLGSSSAAAYLAHEPRAERARLTAVGHAVLPVLDFCGRLQSGVLSLKLWPPIEGRIRAHSVYTPPMPNPQNSALTLTIEFEKFPLPVVYPPIHVHAALTGTEVLQSHPTTKSVPDTETQARLRALLTVDPLYRMSLADAELLWQNRAWLLAVLANSQGLPPFQPSIVIPRLVAAAPWVTESSAAVDAIQIFRPFWQQTNEAKQFSLDEYCALELLDGTTFSNFEVREIAVNLLFRALVSDGDVSAPDSLLFDAARARVISPQLVQALKYEPYHCSALARLLVTLALGSPYEIGMNLFWQLRAEMSNDIGFSSRFALLAETLLDIIPQQLSEDILTQVRVMNSLASISEEIKRQSDPKTRTQLTQQRLQGLSDTEGWLNLTSSKPFHLPLSPYVMVCGLVLEKCRWLDSNSFPLWLVWRNADTLGSDIAVIFKNGDDLRQDILVIQMLGLMDELWQSDDLDLRLTRYTCIATGPDQGLIEVVRDAATSADIQRQAGKKGMSRAPMSQWLRASSSSDESHGVACDTFVRSLAGYCVAMHALGIGDRHNDNIMLTKHGHLFHIDFGHILGNTLTFAGVKRETAPFVLTPEMIHVMGGHRSLVFAERFVGICCKAYNALRRGLRRLMVLFILMLPASLPQLTRFEDMLYLRSALQPTLDEDEAAEHFKKLIKKSRTTTRTLLNNAVHIWAHPK